MAAASDKCQREKRKTIMGDDLLWAMSTLGFENYTEPLKTYLFRYREMVTACSLARLSCQQLGCVGLTVMVMCVQATKSTDDNGEAKTSDAS